MSRLMQVMTGTYAPSIRDGETRIIGTGEVILIEDDLHGKEHLSGAVEGKFRPSILIPVD